jgi:hypothetical protein
MGAIGLDSPPKGLLPPPAGGGGGGRTGGGGGDAAVLLLDEEELPAKMAIVMLSPTIAAIMVTTTSAHVKNRQPSQRLVSSGWESSHAAEYCLPLASGDRAGFVFLPPMACRWVGSAGPAQGGQRNQFLVSGAAERV